MSRTESSTRHLYRSCYFLFVTLVSGRERDVFMTFSVSFSLTLLAVSLLLFVFSLIDSKFLKLIAFTNLADLRRLRRS